MSCSNWEAGTLVIPGAEFKRVRDGIAAAYNKRQVELLELAVLVHARLVAIRSEKGSKALKGGVYEALGASGGDAALKDRLTQAEDGWKVIDKVLQVERSTGKVTVSSPKKKDFAEVSAVKTLVYAVGEFSITLNPAERSLAWSVYENNRAVETARSHPMAKALFRLLAQVKWTRATGGVFTGNDEMRREDRSEGGGENYVTQRFGPLGVDKQLEALKKRVAKRGSVGHARMY